MSDQKSVNVDISAKASLEVPKESTGRLLDALTDIIRPFSEKRGLRADFIRLQREEVLLEIAKSSAKRITAMKGEVYSVPNRVLVPLLEKSSLIETEDVELAGAWSGLLTSAATAVTPNYGVHVDLLSKLSSQHLQFLEALVDGDRQSNFEDRFFDIEGELVDEICQLIGANSRKKGRGGVYFTGDVDSIAEIIAKKLNLSGVLLAYTIVETSPFNKGDGYVCEIEGPSPKERDDYRVTPALESLGLVKKMDDFYFHKKLQIRPKNLQIAICYHSITALGADFYKACHPEWWQAIDGQMKKVLDDLDAELSFSEGADSVE